ncbi:MAG: hypothetical protein JWO26_2198 [Rhodospirillales bacterium]|jgi:uncharacterized protein (DUF1810 family)|nr:hypothetical protein [Rhodospirillales bacterium]
MSDPFALERFVEAQAPVIAAVEAELRSGRKRSHWMWFIFPQLRALGRSGTALHFGIASLDEARAYRAHPILGPRLVSCAGLVMLHRGQSAHAIFGSPDDLKLRSSMTLFAEADPSEPVFCAVIDAFFDGIADAATTRLLAEG